MGSVGRRTRAPTLPRPAATTQLHGGRSTAKGLTFKEKPEVQITKRQFLIP